MQPPFGWMQYMPRKFASLRNATTVRMGSHIDQETARPDYGKNRRFRQAFCAAFLDLAITSLRVCDRERNRLSFRSNQRRAIFPALPPGGVWFVTHIQNQLAASHKFCVGKPGPRQGLAVESRRLDIHVLRRIVLCDDGKVPPPMVARIEMDRRLADQGA